MESETANPPRKHRRRLVKSSAVTPEPTCIEGHDLIANDIQRVHSAPVETDLNTLPHHTQVELAEFLLGHTLAETIAWLSERGIGTTGPALSIFHATFTTRQQLLRFEAMVGVLTEELAKQDPSLTPDRLRELGQSLFTRMAIEKKDAASWKIAQELEMKRSKLDLEWQKFRAQASRAKADENAASEKPEGLSPETTEKIERELKLF